MNAEQREALERELLELYFECHPEPELLQQRLDNEPELAAIYEEVCAQAEFLERAAHVDADRFEPRAEPARPSPIRHLKWLPVGLAAAACVLMLGRWGWISWSYQDLRHGTLDIVVEARTATPDGLPLAFDVTAENQNGDAVDCPLTYAVLDADGTPLVKDRAVANAGTITAPGSFPSARRLLVTAETPLGNQDVEVELRPANASPLVHLDSDKPIYRPGETARFRGVVLDRLTLTPIATEHSYAMRVRDAQDAVVSTFATRGAFTDTTHGVGWAEWSIPEDLAGGNYTLEFYEPDDRVPAVHHEFVVRRFQAPRLDKQLVLDKESYEPGTSGIAELDVQRLAGGAAAGADVEVTLVIDGDYVWDEWGTLDANGRAMFTFEVPDDVEHGEARMFARIEDGGTLETCVEPFVVPTGSITVHAYPEGGDLVSGLPARVYLELADSAGRPVSAKGRILDGKGAEVVAFETRHKGRARVEWTPRADESYSCQIEGPRGATVALPEVRARGVALRALDDVTAAGEPLRLRVHASRAGTWRVGAFCRGMCVASERISGDGAIDVELPIPDSVFGVLRVTVFDDELAPRAERLVQRVATQQIALEVTPDHDELEPGGRQRLRIRARDESGQPVAAALGISVTDRGVQSMHGEPRVGLLDRASLLGDVTIPDDLADYLPSAGGEPEHVDLLLGTLGWRRFLWATDPDEIGERRGMDLDTLRSLDGVGMQIDFIENERDPGAIASARRNARGSHDDLVATAWLSVFGLILYGLAFGVAWGARRLDITRNWRGDACVVAVMVALFAWSLPSMLRSSALKDAMPQTIVEMAAGMANLADAEAPTEDAADFDDWEVVPRTGGEGEGEPLDEALLPVPEATPELDPLAQPEADEEVEEEADEDFAPELRERARFANDAYRLEYLRTAPGREYAHRHHGTAERTDFAETVYWNALLFTDEKGEATVGFDLSDRITTWDAHVSAHGAQRVGQGAIAFDSKLPFFMDVATPVELTAGDTIDLPIGLVADARFDEAELRITASGSARTESTMQRAKLDGGRGRVTVPLAIEAPTGGPTSLRVLGAAGRFRDEVRRELRVVPRGFPHRRSWAGMLGSDASEFVVVVPEDTSDGSTKLTLRVFPSPLSTLRQGLDGILQEPHGCFEQASSSNYPNALVLSYVQATGDNIPSVVAEAERLLPKGYELITGYECTKRGYEWFGSDPGHEALTAYGLMEFRDMAQVFDVDDEMVTRTRDWLMARRSGDGSFLRDPKSLDAFGAAPATVTDAYITYALIYAGQDSTTLEPELARLATRSTTTDDAYELALAACALESSRPDAAAAARQRLAKNQRDDGSLLGKETSITASGERDFAVETTAFAVLAWLADAEEFGARIFEACQFLQSQQTARGTFGATQATIMALKALTANAQQNRSAPTSGTLVVRAGDREIARASFSTADPNPLRFELAEDLTPGRHTLSLVVELDGAAAPIPWACDLAYHSDQPADDPEAVLEIETTLTEGSVEEGKSSAVRITVRNRTDRGQPMSVANVGLPAGLRAPTAVLDALRDAGSFDLWEVRGRTLTFYWRALAPNATQEFSVDCVATLPGTTTGPASSAYLYYTPDSQRWAEPLRLTVR